MHQAPLNSSPCEDQIERTEAAALAPLPAAVAAAAAVEAPVELAAAAAAAVTCTGEQCIYTISHRVQTLRADV